MNPAIPLERAVARSVLFFLPLAVLTVNLGQSVLFAIMPILGRQLGFHEVQITSLVSVSALTYFLVSPAWGRFSDIAGRKTTVLIGIAGYAFGTLAFNQVVGLGLAGIVTGWSLFVLLLPYRILHTGIMAATHPSSSAYVADVTSPSERIRGMSRMAAAVAIGAMAGPIFVYFARFGLLVPLYLTALVTLVILFLLWLRLPDYRVHRESASHTKLSYFDRRYCWYLLVGLVMYAMMATVQQTLGFYFQDHLQMDGVQAVRYFSVAYMLSSAATVFAQLVLVPRFEGGPIPLLRIGLPMAAAGYLGLALAGTFSGCCLAMCLFGLGMGLAGPGYTAGASLQVGPQEQGRLAGLTASIPGLGYVIGPLVGGLAYGVNPAAPYYLAFFLVALLTVFTMVVMRTKQEAAASSLQ